MNELSGKIRDLLVVGDLCQLSIDIQGTLVKSLIIETPESNPKLYSGATVQVLFKETEVILAQDSNLSISISNRLPCIIQSVQKGRILSRVILKFGEFPIASLIITEAWELLNLSIGDRVYALVKANEVMIAS